MLSVIKFDATLHEEELILEPSPDRTLKENVPDDVGVYE
jgi:hypothetical protein